MSNFFSEDAVRVFISFYKLINKQQKKRRTLTGLITSSDKNHALDLLTELKVHISECNQFYPNYDEEDGEVEVLLPPFFYSSLVEMLEIQPLLRSEIPNQTFYFEDIDYIYIPSTNIFGEKFPQIPKVIQNYLKCVSLYALLKTQADHTSINSENIETLYFLNSQKLSITNNLNAINSEILTKLSPFEINYINSNIHKDAIRNIINESLNSFYIDKNISINQVCVDFDSIYDIIKNNYEVYISQFTFEKIKKEVEKFRTESITRINKAFSDIQMQIIAVPASLIVVASSLKTGKDFSVLVNTIVLLGALFFAIAILFMCENQKDTLKNIKYEINAQKNVFTSDPLFCDKREIVESFNILEIRYKKQINNIFFIKIAILISIFTMCSIYIYYLIENLCLNFLIPGIYFLENFYCK